MHKLEITIRYSNDDMDSWEDGSEIKFTIESSKEIINDIAELANQYLKSVGIKYREFMFRTNRIK